MVSREVYPNTEELQGNFNALLSRFCLLFCCSLKTIGQTFFNRRHHHNGRWEARIGRVFGNKYLYLGTYSEFPILLISLHVPPYSYINRTQR